jgi:hypothetical protein
VAVEQGLMAPLQFDLVVFLRMVVMVETEAEEVRQQQPQQELNPVVVVVVATLTKLLEPEPLVEFKLQCSLPRGKHEIRNY